MTGDLKTVYIHLSQKRDIRFPFELSTAGIFCSPENISHDFSYNTLEFCIRIGSTEDEAVDELNGKEYRHRFPHLLIKRPGYRHRYTIRGKRQAVFLIYPPSLLTEFEKTGIDMDTPGQEFQWNAEHEHLLNRFLELIPSSQTRGAGERFDIFAFQWISRIFIQKLTTPDSSGHDISATIREIASYLQLHCCENVDLQQVMDKFRIPRRCFYRHWKLSYPLSPRQYLMTLRMSEAVRLLSIKDLRIQEIADRLGFANQSYFIQAFRRSHQGMTPGEYRNLTGYLQKTHQTPIVPPEKSSGGSDVK